MFYDRFIKLCNEKKEKPSRVAANCNVAKSAVSYWKSKWEKGIEIMPTNENAVALAKYFDVTVDYLLGKSEYKNARDEAYQKEVEKLREYKKGHHLITTLGMGGDRQVDELTEDEYQAAMATVKAIRRAKGMPEE